MYVNLFEIYFKKQDCYLNRQTFRVDMSEVDFTKIIISIPNWSKLPSNIMENEHMKNVEYYVHLSEIYCKKQDYYLNRQIFTVDMSEVDFTKVVISLQNWSKLPVYLIQY
jgi:hypothetical protein